ncbi:MAG: hypothetical protein LW720_20710 [Pirellula sp.]|jgi:hypothetical protein|nr:hypothetical protein [Pirellula sp.]
MKTKNIIIAYVIIILYTIAPILSVMIASSIAQATGSQLDEGGAHPCIVFGFDIGGTLAIMFVMGWFALVTIPTGILSLIGLSVALIWMSIANEDAVVKKRVDSLSV